MGRRPPRVYRLAWRTRPCHPPGQPDQPDQLVDAPEWPGLHSRGHSVLLSCRPGAYTRFNPAASSSSGAGADRPPAMTRDIQMTSTPALSALFLAIVLIASPSAQTAPGKRAGLADDGSRSTTKLPVRWWKDPTIAKVVGLTPVQTERIDTLFDEFLKPQRERWAALRPLEEQLEVLLSEPDPDEKLVIERITAIENRRSELNRNRLIMLFQIQRVLKPWQRLKLQDLGRSPFPATEPRNPKTPR